MTRSMRARLTLVFVLFMAPLIVATSHILLISHKSQRSTTVGQTVKMVVEKSTLILGTHHWQRTLSDLYSQPTVRDLRIGALVADTTDQVVWRSPTDAPAWPLTSEKGIVKSPNGHLTLFVSIPSFLHPDDNDLHQLVIFTALVTLAFGAAAWWLVGRSLSPIRKLARQAALASAEDAGAKLVSPSQDSEMRELVGTLNGFLDRIRETSEVRSRFYAAASHELRTPLQALTGHLEVALGQPRTEEEYLATIQEAAVQSQRLVSLVEGILLLYQLQGKSHAKVEEVHVDAAVEQTLETLQPLIEARGLRLRVDVAKPAVVHAVPAYVSVLIRNLLENAAKYGREGGDLNIVLADSGGVLTFKIENDAPNGSEIDVDRLFEPFYRLDASRSTKSGGNGLGLAICQAAAKANGWNLTLRQQGTLVVATLEFRPQKNGDGPIPG